MTHRPLERDIDEIGATPLELAAPVHGGDLEAVGRRYGVDPAELLDFSANLNPLGPPLSLLHELAAASADVAELQRYPDPEARRLRGTLALQLNVEPNAIVVGNGAAALLGTALAALRVQHCIVPIPAFSEDRHAVTMIGAIWTGVQLDPMRAFALDPRAWWRRCRQAPPARASSRTRIIRRGH
jgi:threonine-phosphate decarboxylase